MKARVEVFLKTGVLDVQGKAIEAALHGLGFPGVGGVRVGRVITMDLLTADKSQAEAEVTAMADRLLANHVIEGYKIEVTG